MASTKIGSVPPKLSTNVVIHCPPWIGNKKEENVNKTFLGKSNKTIIHTGVRYIRPDKKPRIEVISATRPYFKLGN